MFHHLMLPCASWVAARATLNVTEWGYGPIEKHSMDELLQEFDYDMLI